MERTRRMKQLYLFAEVITAVALAISCFMLIKEIRKTTPVAIQAVQNSGSVVFRGVAVDDVWYSPEEIIIANENWVEDNEQATFEATGDDSLQINLPAGENCQVCFTVGPDEGVVNVIAAGQDYELDLYNDEYIDDGKLFQLSGTGTQRVVLQYITAAAMLAFFLAMIAGYLYRNTRLSQPVRSRGIEFYRFIFALVIMMHHIGVTFLGRNGISSFFSAGYLAVDLFFVVSGYFLAAHFERTAGRENSPDAGAEALRYAIGRWKRLFLHSLWAFFAATVVIVYLWKDNSWKNILADGLFEVFLIGETGIGPSKRVNGVSWYCSALIICSYLIYYLLNKNKKDYLKIIIPVSSAIIFAYFYKQYGHLNRLTENPLIIRDGVIRGFAEMSIGCASYYLVAGIKKDEFFRIPKRIEPWLYGAIEVICLIAIIFIMWKPSGYIVGESVPTDFIFIPIMVVFIIVVLSEKSVLYRIENNRLSDILGKLSFSMFLNHLIIQRSITRYLANGTVMQMLVIYLSITIPYSVFTMVFIGKIEGKIKQMKC